MAIEAVVFDIGGVLEINDDALFPGPWCERNGIDRARFDAAFATLPADNAIGAMTVPEVHAHIQRELRFTDEQLEELDADLWTWYVGELNLPIYDWFAGVRDRGLKAAILSNSAPGAREHEACWGFEGLVDVLVYSHEVGLKKPDPQVYALTADRLGVAPGVIAFVDDWLPAVQGALAAGWWAHQHTDNEETIAALEAALAMD